MAIPVKKRFGDILVDGGLITATQLQQALTTALDRNQNTVKVVLKP